MKTAKISEWISLNDAADTWLHWMGHSGVRTFPQHLADLFQEALNNGGLRNALHFKGILLTHPPTGKAQPVTGALESIPSEYFRHPRTFRYQLNLIEQYSDRHDDKLWPKAMRATEAHPQWDDVHLEAQSFFEFLVEDRRSWLIGLVQSGNITIADAESIAGTETPTPLTVDPDPALFNPMNEVHWTFVMALAWVATRSIDAVRDCMDGYRTQRKSWDLSGVDLAKGRGPLLQNVEPADLVSLNVELAFHKTEAGEGLTFEDAKLGLFKELRAGRLAASGVPLDGTTRVRKVIDALEWIDLNIEEIQHRRVAAVGLKDFKAGYVDVMLPGLAILEIWPDASAPETNQTDPVDTDTLRLPTKRGPKPKIDNDTFLAEVHRFIAYEGEPDPKTDPSFRQADVERHMLTWHKNAIGEARNRQLVSAAIKSFKFLKTKQGQ